MEPLVFEFESMGISFQITLWEDTSSQELTNLKSIIFNYCDSFDKTFSRFIKSSLIISLSQKTGLQSVPADLVHMLRMYKKFYKLSLGAFSPFVADTLSDLGYDMAYSLKPKSTIRTVPAFDNAVEIVDDTHIRLHEKSTIDVGALGKGYVVDGIARILDHKGRTHYLVNGSGDIRYKGSTTIEIGLEHPTENCKVIGSMDFLSGAMCSSAGNRRAWGNFHHIIDPFTQQSPTNIIASWVIASQTAIADALATALFLVPPENFSDEFDFEYLLLDKNFRVKRSKGFTATLY